MRLADILATNIATKLKLKCGLLGDEAVRDVSIVVLGKFKDIFEGFFDSAERYLGGYQKIFVRDGYDIPDPQRPDWKVVQGPETFSMAGNANLGWRAADPTHDLLYVSDDVRFESKQPVELLQQGAYSDGTVGILSPSIKGKACNPLQTDLNLRQFKLTPKPLAFICVYIKRDLINKIGFLDEEFNEYGYDDVDYCRRTQQAGYELAVTPFVTIIHWGDAHATFSRNPVWSLEKNRETFRKKWGSI